MCSLAVRARVTWGSWLGKISTRNGLAHVLCMQISSHFVCFPGDCIMARLDPKDRGTGGKFLLLPLPSGLLPSAIPGWWQPLRRGWGACCSRVLGLGESSWLAFGWQSGLKSPSIRKLLWHLHLSRGCCTKQPHPSPFSAPARSTDALLCVMGEGAAWLALP